MLARHRTITLTRNIHLPSHRLPRCYFAFWHRKKTEVATLFRCFLKAPKRTTFHRIAKYLHLLSTLRRVQQFNGSGDRISWHVLHQRFRVRHITMNLHAQARQQDDHSPLVLHSIQNS